MNKKLLLLLCGLLIALTVGCGKREDNQSRPGAAGHGEELADSTRLDSASTSDSGGD